MGERTDEPVPATGTGTVGDAPDLPPALAGNALLLLALREVRGGGRSTDAALALAPNRFEQAAGPLPSLADARQRAFARLPGLAGGARPRGGAGRRVGAGAAG